MAFDRPCRDGRARAGCRRTRPPCACRASGRRAGRRSPAPHTPGRRRRRSGCSRRVAEQVVLGEIKEQQRLHSVEREALPHLGEEADVEPLGWPNSSSGRAGTSTAMADIAKVRGPIGRPSIAFGFAGTWPLYASFPRSGARRMSADAVLQSDRGGLFVDLPNEVARTYRARVHGIWRNVARGLPSPPPSAPGVSSMKPLVAALSLSFAAPAFAAQGVHPFDVHDLVMMDRVSDPSLSPDGKLAAFAVRETDYEANKGSNGIWIVPSGSGKTVRLTDKALNATSPRWSADGSVYFLAAKDGVAQIWRVGANGGAAETKTSLALDINNFKLSPDGKHVLLSIDVFNECGDDAQGFLACTKKRLDERKADKASGTVYDKIFITSLGYLGRRSPLAAFHCRHRRRRQDRRAAPAQQGHRWGRAVQAFRRRQRIRILAGRRDGLFRRAHRRQDRALVDELRHLLGSGGRFGGAEESHRRQSSVGRLSAAVGERQDALLPGDEAAGFRGGSFRHLVDRSCQRYQA